MLLIAALLLVQQTPLTYLAPAGWTRTVAPNSGLVSLSPPSLARGKTVVMAVFPAEAFSGSAADYHDAVVRLATTGARQLDQPQQKTVGSFLVTLVHQQIPAGAVWARIYTARWGSQAQAFFFSANVPDPRYAIAADSMVAGIAVPAAASPPPVSPPLHPGPLDGVYLTLKNKGGLNYGVSKDYMVFFPDGQVFWHLPEEGLLDFDVAGSHRSWAEFWGRYEMQGSRVHVTFNNGEYSGLKNADGTVMIGGYTYVHQTSGADGRTLSGIYRAYNLGQDPSNDVTFYPDGRFVDKGIRSAVGALDLSYGRAKVPTGPGSGRYRIARYSIVFDYSDGRREQLSFYVPDDDGSTTPKQLVINTFNVVRVSP